MFFLLFFMEIHVAFPGGTLASASDVAQFVISPLKDREFSNAAYMFTKLKVCHLLSPLPLKALVL